MLIDDVEYVLFRHPGLSAVRQFMVDCGLLDAGCCAAGRRAMPAHLYTYGCNKLLQWGPDFSGM